MAVKKKLSNKIIIEVLQKTGGLVSPAARKMNIERSTLYSWIKKSPELQKALKQIRESVVDLLESKLMERVKEGDTTAIIFGLKCLGKNRGYIEKQQIEHSGDMMINVQYRDNK